MSNYNSLKNTIDANIKQNGNQEITGQILNSVLNAMVTTLGTGYQFAGVATIATNPGTPDAKVFYIANGKGTYEKFGGLEVTEDDVVVFYWDSAWHKVATGIASQEKLSELEAKLFFDVKTISGNPCFFDKPCSVRRISTSQDTTIAISGKNISYIEDFSVHRETAVTNLDIWAEGGVLHVNGVNGGSSGIRVPLTNKSFTLKSGMSVTISQDVVVDGVNINYSNRSIQSGNTRTFILSSDSLCNADRNFVELSPGQYDNVEIRFQAEIGSEATEFEPFVGEVVNANGDTDVSIELPKGMVAIASTGTPTYTLYVDKEHIIADMRDFGVKGDGVTDDSDAIQAFINKNRKVYFPSGIFLISKTITIPSNTTIVGNGDATKIKLLSANNLTPIQWRTQYGSVDDYFFPYFITETDAVNISVSDIFIEGNTTSETQHIETGLCIYHAKNVTLKNIHIERVNYFPDNSLPRPSGQWRRGWNISMFYAENVELANSIFRYASYENVRVGDYCKGVHVHDCLIEWGWRTGLQILKGADGIIVENCIINQNDFNKYDTEACLTLHSAEGEPISNITLKGCVLNGISLFETGAGVAQAISFIDFYDKNIVIENCKVTASGCVRLLGVGGDNVVVRNCTLSGDGDGVQMMATRYDGASLTLVGNTINCTNIGVYGYGNKLVKMRVEDNDISCSSNNGIYVTEGIEMRAVVKGNRINVGGTATGCLFGSSVIVKRSIIEGNIFEGGNYGLRGASMSDSLVVGNSFKGTAIGTNVSTTNNLVANNL